MRAHQTTYNPYFPKLDNEPRSILVTEAPYERLGPDIG